MSEPVRWGEVRDRLLGYIENPARESEPDGLFGVSDIGWWGTHREREVFRHLFSMALSGREALAQRDTYERALREIEATSPQWTSAHKLARAALQGSREDG